MKRFEYKTVEIKLKGTWNPKFDIADVDKELNKMGSQGWELVSVESRDMGGTPYGYFYTLQKRNLKRYL